MLYVWQAARVLFPLPFEDRRNVLTESVRAEPVHPVDSPDGALIARVPYATTVSPAKLHMALNVRAPPRMGGACVPVLTYSLRMRARCVWCPG